MNDSHPGQVLIIDKDQGKNTSKLMEMLSDVDVTVDYDLGTAIHRFQKNRFDTIVVDANIKGMQIDRIIQILKDIDPTIKIIVKTDRNSKTLEAKIRKEEIYYYHLDSFGPDDLKLAIDSAVVRKPLYGSNIKYQNFAGEKSKLVLMVDEDDRFIDIHKTNLENHDYRVTVCYDADEGIERAKKETPNIILVDINTPLGSEGLHFIEMLMNEKRIMSIPLLIFITKIMTEKYEKILERVESSLPIWSYLEKPIKIEEVIPKIEELTN
ncbi:response regulator [candidate division KSB1 bacterium]|nr:response regulator [candidate division KSB1 bacterium]